MTEEYDYRMNGVNQPAYKAHFRQFSVSNKIIHTDEYFGTLHHTWKGTARDHPQG